MIPNNLFKIAALLESPKAKNYNPNEIHLNYDKNWIETACGIRGFVIATLTIKEVTCEKCLRTKAYLKNKHKVVLTYRD